MALPELYEKADRQQTTEQYFEDAITFLRKFEWIYNFPNTDVLVENIFEKFPPGWRYHLEKLSCIELNEIPFGICKDSWPPSLQAFVRQIQMLKPQYTIANHDQIEIKLTNNFTRGLNPKKQHEIINLSKFIHEKCQKHQITTIIDVGAGLGYISHLLHENFGYKIVAIESDQTRYDSALRRQEKYHSASKENVRYFKHFVNANSAEAINSFLENWSNGACVENTCLIGLHACADLTVTSMDIFLKLDFIKLLVIMPCCYHKLEMCESKYELTGTPVNSSPNLNRKSTLEQRNSEYFLNFPISKELRQVYVGSEGWGFLKRPFLRVACQSSASVWRGMSEEEHRQHSISHMRRAVLQFFVTKENYLLAKLKRKCMNRFTSSNCDFETYLKQLDQGFYLVANSDGAEVGSIIKDYAAAGCKNNELKFTSAKIQSQLTDLWTTYEPDCPAIEILTCLQNCVQSICENVILLDRVAFLREHKVQSFVEKVTQDHISPRCHALIAYKPSHCAPYNNDVSCRQNCSLRLSNSSCNNINNNNK